MNQVESLICYINAIGERLTTVKLEASCDASRLKALQIYCNKEVVNLMTISDKLQTYIQDLETDHVQK